MSANACIVVLTDRPTDSPTDYPALFPADEDNNTLSGTLGNDIHTLQTAISNAIKEGNIFDTDPEPITKKMKLLVLRCLSVCLCVQGNNLIYSLRRLRLP